MNKNDFCKPSFEILLSSCNILTDTMSVSGDMGVSEDFDEPTSL